MNQQRNAGLSACAALAAGMLALGTPAGADDEALQPAALIGITEGSVYTRPAKPRWYDAADTVSSCQYSINGGQWLSLENGQRLSDGDYEVKIRTESVSSEAYAEDSISFTVNTAAEQALIESDPVGNQLDRYAGADAEFTITLVFRFVDVAQPATSDLPMQAIAAGNEVSLRRGRLLLVTEFQCGHCQVRNGIHGVGRSTGSRLRCSTGMRPIDAGLAASCRFRVRP